MLKDYTNLIEAIHSEIVNYNEKPTKAGSARIRKLSLQIGKEGAMFRQYMLKLDKKAQYDSNVSTYINSTYSHDACHHIYNHVSKALMGL